MYKKSTPGPTFCPTREPGIFAPDSSFLSEPDLGLRAQIPKFCPTRTLAYRGINRGPRFAQLTALNGLLKRANSRPSQPKAMRVNLRGDASRRLHSANSGRLHTGGVEARLPPRRHSRLAKSRRSNTPRHRHPSSPVSVEP
jgi:hypothetical protein